MFWNVGFVHLLVDLSNAFNYLLKRVTWRIFRIVNFGICVRQWWLSSPKRKIKTSKKPPRFKRGFVPRRETSWKTGETQGNQLPAFPRAAASIASLQVRWPAQSLGSCSSLQWIPGCMRLVLEPRRAPPCSAWLRHEQPRLAVPGMLGTGSLRSLQAQGRV